MPPLPILPVPLQTRTPLEVVTDWAVRLMETLGGPGAGLAVALENIFPPLPSELILPLAGFTASRGQLGLVEAIVWTTIGSLVGALGLYAAGRALGRERVRRIAVKVPLVSAADVDRTHDWFDRHGAKAVFFGRMLPLFRSFISIPAGVEAMPVHRFALLTTAGSLIWNTVFILAGYALGENWQVVEEYAGVFQLVVVGLVVGALTVFVIRRVRTLRSTR